MIFTNFSTRPFYNERGVYLALGILAVVVVVLVTLSLGHFSRLFQEESALGSAVVREQGEMNQLNVEIQMLGTEMSGTSSERLACDARGERIASPARIFMDTVSEQDRGCIAERDNADYGSTGDVE